MRLLFSIGAVLAAGMFAGGDVAGIAAPGPKFEPPKSQPQRSAADRDAQTVDVELILAVDVSYSMDMDELAIQREGYAQAIQSKEFLQALKLGPNGRIAVTYFEWAASSDQKIIIPWRLVDGPETADAVAAEIMKTPIRRASRTSISGAITFAMPLFEEDPYRGLRRVIDISGDGPNNTGLPVAITRDAAVAKGIVINGLPILISPSPTFSHLDQYYDDCVTGGPGSFVLPIYAASEFATAIRRKLILEVSGIADATAVTIDAAAPMDCLQGERDRRLYSDPYFPELDK